jgi:ketosteroid isomerase-like protein
MKMKKTRNQKGPGNQKNPSMKNTVLLRTIMLASVLFSCSQVYSAKADTPNRKDTVEEKIWALEEAYFSNLYIANYEGVLVLVHNQFLGWPGALSQPIGREESARFMKQLIPKPTACTIRIERAGIRVLGAVALTQYTLHVNCSDTAGATKTQSSRITHTWVKEGDRWKLLGGMSYDN